MIRSSTKEAISLNCRHTKVAVRVFLLSAVLASALLWSPLGHPDTSAIKVMTFNIRWSGPDQGGNNWDIRKSAVLRLLQKHRPDIIALQETSPDQLEFLKSSLPAYQVFSALHDLDAAQPIFFRRNRFKFDTGGSFWLVEKSALPGGARRCAWLTLIQTDIDQKIIVFNAHLDHRSALSRKSSVISLTQELITRESAATYLIMGDFNDVDTSPIISYLRGEASISDRAGKLHHNRLPLRDAVREFYPDTSNLGTAHGFLGRQDGPRIDYIFFTGGIRVLGAGVIHDREDGVFPSDHFPVWAKLDVAD